MNTKNRKINKKFSSDLNKKLAVRYYACKQGRIDEVNVLDCFHGKGIVWSKMRQFVKVNKVMGIECNESLESPFPVVYGDNLEILKCINIDEYNVIDLDAYGEPWKQMEIIFERAKLPKIIIYTEGLFYYHGMVAINAFPETLKICCTIMNQYHGACKSYYFYKKGIKEYYETIAKNRGMKVTYGYFIYNPS